MITLYDLDYSRYSNLVLSEYPCGSHSTCVCPLSSYFQTWSWKIVKSNNLAVVAHISEHTWILSRLWHYVFVPVEPSRDRDTGSHQLATKTAYRTGPGQSRIHRSRGSFLRPVVVNRFRRPITIVKGKATPSSHFLAKDPEDEVKGH